MIQKVLTIAWLTSISFSSCTKTQPKENIETPTKIVETTKDEIVNSTEKDKEGKQLEMSFNNTKDIVTLKFNGESIELVGQKPASGIWYKNDEYELMGKGEELELTKNGKTVFKTAEKTTMNVTSDTIKHELKNQKQKTKEQTWWLGKELINNRPISKNPEEGGPDFLRINSNKTADFNVGDIVEQMTWEAEQSNLTLTNKMTKRKIVFKIGDSYLSDEYGTKWTVKK